MKRRSFLFSAETLTPVDPSEVFHYGISSSNQIKLGAHLNSLAFSFLLYLFPLLNEYNLKSPQRQFRDHLRFSSGVWHFRANPTVLIRRVLLFLQCSNSSFWQLSIVKPGRHSILMKQRQSGIKWSSS